MASTPSHRDALLRTAEGERPVGGRGVRHAGSVAAAAAVAAAPRVSPLLHHLEVGAISPRRQTFSRGEAAVGPASPSLAEPPLWSSSPDPSAELQLPPPPPQTPLLLYVACCGGSRGHPLLLLRHPAPTADPPSVAMRVPSGDGMGQKEAASVPGPAPAAGSSDGSPAA